MVYPEKRFRERSAISVAHITTNCGLCHSILKRQGIFLRLFYGDEKIYKDEKAAFAKGQPCGARLAAPFCFVDKKILAAYR